VISGRSGRLIVSGVGKSGLIAKKIAATLTSTGTPSFYIHPVEAAHGDLGLVNPDDVVMIISKSGMSDELRQFIPSLRRLGVKIIAMTGDDKSFLAKNSDVVLDTRVEKEAGSLGLAPTGKMAMFEGQFSPLRNLALFDPPLARPQPDWPANVRVCGAPMHDGGGPDAETRADLERFLAAGDPPIVFALGSSAVWVAGDFWDHATAAARRLGRRAVLITGPVTPGNLPDEVRAYPYLPFSIVFPRAAAVVHQAGIGTLAQAMRSGRPQLIVPVAFDQPDNARRAAALGVARLIPFKKVTVRRLVDALAAVLEEPQYAHRARAVAAGLAGIDGAARAADELIALAG